MPRSKYWKCKLEPNDHDDYAIIILADNVPTSLHHEKQEQTTMIRVGTCSFAEKSLIQSGEFYPPPVKTAEARLRYYASHFDTVEVDSTYYAIPDQKTAWLWDMRTPKGFIFHIKAYGALTGHGVDPRTLPADIRGLVTGLPQSGRFVYVKERETIQAIGRSFTEALLPLKRAGKLGLMVFQFPPWFQYSRANMDYILFSKQLMGDLPLAVEFRHGSWLSSSKASAVFDFLSDNRITYVVADEPQYGTLATVPFVPRVTTGAAYFRFHGRNKENWLRKNIETSLRYAYSYSDDELQEFIPAIRQADKEAKEIYAMFNNCHRGNATTNAARLKQLLET
jgi:uncharacterized protein YecE (DUF72 family)